jgi:acyl-homoserine-lactone acylase
MREAAALLAGWDREFSADSRAALLFEAWARLFAGNSFSGTANFAVPFDPARATSTPSGLRDPAAAVAQLRSAIDSTLKLHGRLDRPFGAASRLRVGDADLPGDGQTGGLGPLRVLGWTAPDAQGMRKASFGETWVALIEFSTPVKAWGLMSYGNARQPGSPHRADQLPLFAAHRLRPLWLQRAEVEAHTAEVTPLDPLPAPVSAR